MPIKACTLPGGGSGFQWGDHGTCYADRAAAEKQAEAAHANGFAGDEFNESDHPRSANGEFGSGGSGSSKVKLTPEIEGRFPNLGGSIPDFTEMHPETGTFAAVKTDDGQIFIDTKNQYHTHVSLINGWKIPPDKVESGGWFVNGEYESTGRSDSVRYSEQAKSTLKVLLKKGSNKNGAHDNDLALDASIANRRYDADGQLHILTTRIAKAGVSPYFGREIPDADKNLALEPNRIYYLLRDPGELAKSASTFARKEILFKHIPVDSEDIQKDVIAGTIGSDIVFDAPYIVADVAIWLAEAIAGIETDTVREFSPGYRYKPVMTPGVFEGQRYDGVMTEIEANHLCLVETGRQGSDVIAADNKLETNIMDMTKLGKALYTALTAAYPKLANDAGLPALVAPVTRKTYNRTALSKAIFAMDAAIPKEKAETLMDSIAEVEEEKKAKDAEETEEEKKEREKKEAKDKAAKDAEESEEEKKKAKDKAAKDAEGELNGKKVAAAMDSFKLELREAEDARRAVRATVGDVLAMDSASDIYTFALDNLKVDHAGVTGVPALKALFNLASSKGSPAPRIAQDSAAITTQFPGAFRVRQA